MSKFQVTVQLIVEADDEHEAYLGCQSAVDNLVGGDILEADVDAVSTVPSPSRQLYQIIADIDWELLRNQKAQLLAALHEQKIGFDANGVVVLIDAIQDAAVADGIAGEEIVFGNKDD